jgi:hypothetical protein
LWCRRKTVFVAPNKVLIWKIWVDNYNLPMSRHPNFSEGLWK